MGLSITSQTFGYQSYPYQRTSGGQAQPISAPESSFSKDSNASSNVQENSQHTPLNKHTHFSTFSGDDGVSADQPVSAISASDSVSTSTEKEAIEQKVIQQEVQALSKRDQEVRTHERTHAAIGGQHASAPSFSYERGPDGQLYAVEGEVRIDTSAVSGDPKATLEKAEVIIRAALSVAEPSTQDRQVASDARMMAAEARAEMLKGDESLEEAQEPTEEEIKAEEEKAAEAEREAAREKPSLAEVSDTRDTLEARLAAAEQLQSFNERLYDINQAIRKMNERLVETGAFERTFPMGSVIDQSA